MALLLLVPLGIIAVFALAGYGFGALGRVGVRQADRGLRFRCAAAVLGAGAVALYTWGLLHVGGAVLDAEDGGAGSSPMRSCRTADEAQWSRSVGYRVDYFPLRFVCETSDGGSYTPDTVPGYIGPAVGAFALAAVVCGGAAAVESERRTRRRGGAT
ncbi:hypothetical protein GA0115239_10602 [Streptomyces sp. BpilaLS-43]|uniref:hypothetical protein n=1 Tax=Streptomyces sp. BpilaLS-43 TaxID=1839778 RepID=UPI00081B6D6C|nr:hypothetical protein [Streptomyces sp. BpilaLS-43]SCD69764.1 hypothetical protein GA0115239_10602 [Streptomyces sp. BpilaLS-43]